MEQREASQSQKLDDLLYKNRLHSAQIRLLQEEIQYLSMENAALRQKAKESENRVKKADDGQAHREPQGSPEVTAPPSPPGYLRNSSSFGGRAVVETAPLRRDRDHFGMERFLNMDSSLTSTRPRKNQGYARQGDNVANPRQPYNGGFYIMRFHEMGYNTVNIGLKGLQSILKNCNGLFLGIAQPDKIYVLESNYEGRNWVYSRGRQPREDRASYRMTDNCMAILWFASQDSAINFFSNSFHNRFKEPDQPSQHSYEAFFVPANCTPAERIHISYLFIELKLRNYDQTNLTQFEGELCTAIQRLVPDSLPMIVSSRHRVDLKPGNMLGMQSKLYVCMFYSQSDVDAVYRSGIVPRMTDRWSLPRPDQMFSCTLLP